jgi:phosphopantothenoylcysteine decarboxylase / phosphopantothenate---cysteine ligase
MPKGCIVLGVSGGIAAYKAVDLARRLIKEGYRVKTVMTANATRLVTPLTFESVTGSDVATSLFREGGQPMYHISLAQEADLVLVAPATADILAKMAAGIADDLLSTTLLSTRAPVIVAPAMNTSMYLHPATRHNLSVLRERGIVVVGPASGSLACGEEGEGRMVEPDELLEAVKRELEGQGSLRGVKVLVTAGGTREPLDAVRFLGNRSSGKMGFALAEAARRQGAEVVLVSGPTWLEPPPGVAFHVVETARQMYQRVLEEAGDAEVVIKAAAVADFTPAKVLPGKVKKEEAELTLELERTPDILAELGVRKRPGQVLVGFSAETGQVLENAAAKLGRKNLDLMVANDVSRPDAGFEVDTNQAWLVSADGAAEELPMMSKAELARVVVERVAELRGRGGS